MRLPFGPIRDFCERHGIHRLSLFGSAARGDAGPDSDLDVLVEFEPEHVPGLLRLAGIERELSDLLGVKVDMRTPEDLSRHFRHEVLATAQVKYAKR